MNALRTLLAILVTAAIAAQATLAQAPQDDARLGGDAGNTRATATPLPTYGTYKGELRAHDDDWYTTLRAPGPACVAMDATGDAWADATLAVRTGATTYGVRAPIVANATTRLAVAGSSVTQTWEGFVRVPNPAGNDAARPKGYAFRLDEGPAGTGDGGGLGDAGDALATARPIAGGCASGSLRPFYGIGDAVDVYSFHALAGHVIYSVGATAPVRLQLLDAAGTAVGPSIGGDEIVSVSVPEGTYHLKVTTPSMADEVLVYVFGLLGPDPPPGSPCRPHCVVTT